MAWHLVDAKSFTFFTAHPRSCGKVMLSVVSVNQSICPQGVPVQEPSPSPLLFYTGSLPSLRYILPSLCGTPFCTGPQFQSSSTMFTMKHEMSKLAVFIRLKNFLVLYTSPINMSITRGPFLLMANRFMV